MFRQHPESRSRLRLCITVVTIVDVGSSSNDERVFFHDAVPGGVVKVKAGSSITLDCEAGGTPTPTIHWLFEGGRIPQVEHFTHVTITCLSLANASHTPYSVTYEEFLVNQSIMLGDNAILQR